MRGSLRIQSPPTFPVFLGGFSVSSVVQIPKTEGVSFEVHSQPKVRQPFLSSSVASRRPPWFKFPKRTNPQRKQGHFAVRLPYRRRFILVKIDTITGQIIDCAIKVHSCLGPGLLEGAYEACLVYEMLKRGLPLERQKSLPVIYDGVTMDLGYRIDLLVADLVVVELKAVERHLPIHDAQLLSYLRLSGKRVGLLLNFHALHMRDGIKRLVNGFPPG